jgi:hypothetical protein
MVARVRREPDLLAVVFERDGEEPQRILAADPRMAAVTAVGMIITARELRDGDRITVTAAEKLDDEPDDERSRRR